MRTRLGSAVCVWCWLGLALIAALPPRSCLADEDVLSKIREAQQRREAMIRSVHFLVKYTTTKRGEGPLEVEEEWYLERDKALSIKSRAKPGEPKQVVSWDSSDGNWNYHCNFWADEPGKVEMITKLPANPRELRQRCSLLQATGESLVGFQETLGTLLQREECEVLVDDKYLKNCVRVRMGAVNFTSGKPHWVNVWFDPAGDYLPRYCLIASARITEKFLNRKLGGKLDDGEIIFVAGVSDYQDWHDAATNVSIKFPWRTARGASHSSEYVILSVNEPLPPSRLIPQMDRGVEIITNPSTPRQSSQIVGGEPDARAHFARTMTAGAVRHGAASLKVAQEAPLAVAEPRSFFSRRSTWLGIAVAVMAVFGIVWRVSTR